MPGSHTRYAIQNRGRYSDECTTVRVYTQARESSAKPAVVWLAPRDPVRASVDSARKWVRSPQ